MKKKKDNKKEKLITYFKEYMEKATASRGLASYLSFEEEDNDGDKIIYANIDMNGYSFIIEYGLVGDTFINLEHYIKYKNDETLFDIAEIFALFDIDDFKSYSFLENTENGMVDKAIDTLLDMVQKYDFDIRKAGEGSNFKKLADTKQKDSWMQDSEKVRIRDAMRLGTAHTNYRRKPNEKNKQKYIKELENFENKGRLAAEDKRILDKLKAGKDIKFELEQDDIDHDYGIKFVIIASIFTAISFAICFGVFGVLYYLRSKEGLLVINTSSYLAIAISAIAFSIGFDWGVAPRLARKLVEKKGHKVSKNVDDTVLTNKLQKFIAYYIAPVFMPLVGAIIFIMGAPSLIMSDTSIIDYSFVTKNEVPYSQMHVYSVKGETDDEEKFEKYDYPYYAFVDENEAVYEFGPIKNPKAQTKVNEIFDKNNITPTSIKTTDQFYNFD